MKLFIATILVKILDKMSCTVVMGVKAKGEIHTNRNNQFFYSNDFTDIKLFYQNGQEFNLPEGKFEIKTSLNNESGEYNEWYRKVVDKSKK